MPKQVLNALTVKKVEAASSPGAYCDGRGLYLQVRSATNKSWIFRYTPPGGSKPRHIGLGSVHDVTLAEARDRAHELGRRVRVDRVDPLAEARAARPAPVHEPARPKAPTFEECTLVCFAERKKGNKVKSQQQDFGRLVRYVFPTFGAVPIDLPTTDNVVAVLQPIWTTMNPTAVRVREALELVFDYAVFKHYRSDNPAVWEGHLDNLFAKPSAVHKTKHFVALALDDVPAFMRKLRACEGAKYRAAELTILTVARSHMVRDGEWGEVDRKNRAWTICRDKMKMDGQDHKVPLTPRMIAILDEMEQVRENQYVFPGAIAPRMGAGEILKTIKEVAGDDTQTIHGWRAVFRTWFDELTEYADPNLAEMVMAHALPDAVAKAYRRGTMFEKRRAVMQAWEDYCSQ